MPIAKGLIVREINLTSCSFQVVNESLVDTTPNEASSSRSLSYDLRQHKEANDSVGNLRQSLGVNVRGKLGEAVVWEASATYRAVFSWSEESGFSEDQARRVHVSAIIWSFARELIADLSRRAGVGTVMLAPMRFAPSPTEKPTSL